MDGGTNGKELSTEIPRLSYAPTLIARTIAWIGASATAERLARAGRLLARRAPPIEALMEIKCGGYVVETVGASFYCFLFAPDDPELAITTAVQGGFDADTTGAVTGAIAGAYAGASSLPAAWLSTVEAADEIEALADGLFAIAAPAVPVG